MSGLDRNHYRDEEDEPTLPEFWRAMGIPVVELDFPRLPEDYITPKDGGMMWLQTFNRVAISHHPDFIGLDVVLDRRAKTIEDSRSVHIQMCSEVKFWNIFDDEWKPIGQSDIPVGGMLEGHPRGEPILCAYLSEKGVLYVWQKWATPVLEDFPTVLGVDA